MAARGNRKTTKVNTLMYARTLTLSAEAGCWASAGGAAGGPGPKRGNMHGEAAEDVTSLVPD